MLSVVGVPMLADVDTVVVIAIVVAAVLAVVLSVNVLLFGQPLELPKHFVINVVAVII